MKLLLLLIVTICTSSRLAMACRAYIPDIANIANLEQENDTAINAVKDMIRTMPPVKLVSWLLKLGIIQKQEVGCSNAWAGVWSTTLVPDASMTASSVNSAPYYAYYGRIGDTRSSSGYPWLASNQREGEWLQVDLGRKMRLNGIITSGGTSGHYSTKFTIQYAEHLEGPFQTIQDERGEDKMFAGNTGYTSQKTTIFPEPIVARFVKYVVGPSPTYAAVKLEYLVC